jgi:hypothetical protein
MRKAKTRPHTNVFDHDLLHFVNLALDLGNPVRVGIGRVVVHLPLKHLRNVAYRL